MTLSKGEAAPEVADVDVDDAPEELPVADARGSGLSKKKSSLSGADKADKAAVAMRAKVARGQIRATAIPPKSVRTSYGEVGLLGELGITDVKMGSLKRTLTGQEP